MATIDLTKYGITGNTEVLYNPSYDTLYAEENLPGLEGFEVGTETNLGAMNVMTGVYTGRSPKDKFFVMDDVSRDTVWWTSEGYKNDNHPMSEDVWAKVHEELGELEEEIRKGDKEKSEQELGDFIFSLVNAARLYHINPDNALELTNQKFISRFNYIEQKAKEKGIQLADMTLGEMDALWNEAKKNEL